MKGRRKLGLVLLNCRDLRNYQVRNSRKFYSFFEHNHQMICVCELSGKAEQEIPL